MAVSLQVQSVIYNNEKSSLLRALQNLANAVRVNRETTGELGDLTVCYGDASPEPVFSDEEIAAVSERFSAFFRFRYTFFGENTGSARGHNRLGETCENDYMMIMNPDVIVCPTFFGGMIAPFLDPSLEAGITEARQTPIEHPKEYNPVTLETDWATTACAIFPTGIFRKLNGFDADTFFLYCDDVDFSWRVRLLGKKIYYRADCPVFHAKRLSENGKWNPTSAEVYYSLEASLFMAYKWCADDLFAEIYNRISSSNNSAERKVFLKFEQMKRDGTLPERLDPKHRVAKFVGYFYTEHRFDL